MSSEGMCIAYNEGNCGPPARESTCLVAETRAYMATFYHALALSLESGTPSRPPLPLELVRHIMHLAECMLTCESLTVKSTCHRGRAQHNPEYENVQADTSETVRKLWIHTPPLAQFTISKLCSVKLSTLSRNQGWVSSPSGGNWSWFELGLYETSSSNGSSSDPTKVRTADLVLRRRKDGSELTWVSHYNNIQCRDFRWVNTPTGTFGPNHEIWSYIREGDVVGVSLCARYPAWRCIAKSGVLKFSSWFEPILAPRATQREEKKELKRHHGLRRLPNAV
ncbi:hypothetical protein SISSUDRAFT_871000 [Sistotremastrum suecicum HHB10207 ss-3]|uniref:Uncharacterized protein n=1 Tax=Sistotremastrum suecicum HHB10207 ss-3 TaxID=1314776 RepID=A0A166CCA7_9AGAM|nr:hypothetical protein SISSUDRAFT_871000 [Sistotremastrum suecicum HHB10207 ss-3]